jgi:hypothetical protein
MLIPPQKAQEQLWCFPSFSFGLSVMLILSEYVDMQASGQVETVRASYMATGAKQKELESANARLTARRV